MILRCPTTLSSASWRATLAFAGEVYGFAWILSTGKAGAVIETGSTTIPKPNMET